MILSDRGIADYMTRGFTLVWRMLNKARQPASVDVRLGSGLQVYMQHPADFVIDIRDPEQRMEWIPLGQQGYILPPGGFVLGSTRERVTVPNDLCAFVAGRSGIARIGLQIEAAGLLDPGYAGCPTLEIVNLAPYPIRLYDAMPIGQVYWVKLDQPAEFPYGHRMLTSKYQGNTEPMPSAMWKEAS